jgi:hypothetical protein
MLGAPSEEDKLNLIGTSDKPGYQRYGLEQAKNLYQLQRTTPTYPLAPVVPMTPSQTMAQRMTTGYGFGDRPLGMQHGAENTLMNMLSGQIDTGAGTPWDAARQARRSRAVRGLTEDILPGIREGITTNIPGGGTRGDIVQGLAIGRQQETLDEQDRLMELEAMKMAQQRQAAGLGAYQGIMGAPAQFYSGIGQAVTPERDIQQAMRDADRAMYDQRRREAIEAMQGYGAGITNIVGGFANLEDLKKKGLLG